MRVHNSMFCLIVILLVEHFVLLDKTSIFLSFCLVWDLTSAANEGKVRMISCGADKSVYFRTAHRVSGLCLTSNLLTAKIFIDHN